MELNRRFFDSLMAEKKLSLRGLAAKMGMGHSQLSLTFSGGRKLQLDEAAQLSQIFNVPLYIIVENAGVSVKPIGGKRAQVIGTVLGDGAIELYDSSVIERTMAPEGMPDDTVAVQCRTAGTSLDWMDGSVLFLRRPDGIDPAYLGRLCMCKIKDGPVVLAMVKRGYRDNTSNLSGPYLRESVTLEWASPVILTRN